MRHGKVILITALALGVSNLFCIEVYARRSGGFRSTSSRSSSSRMSSRSSSSRRTASTRTSTWKSSKRPASFSSSSSSSKTKASTFGTRSKATSTKRQDAAEQKLYEKAYASGTAYSSKAEATDAFKAKHGRQYGSRYASQPTTRPTHIPQTTMMGGTTYNIVYNRRYGGYGYMGPRGSWIMYDALADAVMLDMLMSRNYYYYDRYGANRVGGGDPLKILVWFGIICVVFIVGSAIYLHVFDKG